MKTASELAQELGISGAALRNYRVEAGIAAKTRSAGYSASEVALIRAVAQRRGNKLAQPPLTDSARETTTSESIALQSDVSATPSYVGVMGDFIPETSDAQNRILERLESIESKIDGLFALLDKAVIASRYISRADVESASGNLPIVRAKTNLHSPRPHRGNGGVPRFTEFASWHNIPERTANDHARKWLTKKELLKVVPLPDGKQEYYITKEQEAGVIAWWQSIGYPFSMCCAECPNEHRRKESEAQE